MLSRVANSLFWLARYLERGETAARFLVVTHGYAQELRSVSHVAGGRCWGVARELFTAEGADDEDGRDTFRRLALDPERDASMLNCISLARENARGIRDAIPSEMWEQLNVLYLRLQEETGRPPSEAAELSLLERVKNVAQSLLGLRESTMVRGDEWHFLRLGQCQERATFSIRIMDGMFTHPALWEAAEVGQSIDTIHLAATLRVFTASEAFSRAGHNLTLERVAEFLLLDARFPRSVEFAIQELGYSLHALSGTAHDIFSNDAEQLCGRLLAELRFASIEEIVAQDLHEYLLRLQHRVDQLGAMITQLYFP